MVLWKRKAAIINVRRKTERSSFRLYKEMDRIIKEVTHSMYKCILLINPIANPNITKGITFSIHI